MSVQTFSHKMDSFTTISAIESLIKQVKPTDIVFSFAYASMSGCLEFRKRFGEGFWATTNTKWLLSIDYGRTPPSSLKFIMDKPNAEVRVFDGETVSKAAHFTPSQPFHMKVCIMFNKSTSAYGMIVGSGNLSLGGLVQNIECGASIFAKNKKDFKKSIYPTYKHIMEMWSEASPAADILKYYEKRWIPTKVPSSQPKTPKQIAFNEKNADLFWIEAGYVTQNRGNDKPGNQIDFPRGVHSFFGLKTPKNPQKNTSLGDVDFLVQNKIETKSLRLGDNLMEKITLPFPEDIGIEAYDGKVIQFRKTKSGFVIATHELSDFLNILSLYPNADTQQMKSGRLYGYVKE